MNTPSIARLVRWELFKLARRPASYIGVVLCLVFVGLVLGGYLKNDFRMLKKYGGLVDPRSFVTAASFVSFTLNIAFFAMLPVIAATLASGQFAGEAKDGTLRAWMMRPISRPRIATAKWLATFIWLLMIVLFLAVLAYVVGLVALGSGNMVVFVWQFREQGIWFIASPDWLYCLLAIVLVSSLSMMVLVSFTLFMSALVDNPMVALAASLGLFFISSVMQQLPPEVFGDGMRQWLPTTHMNLWHEMYRVFRIGGGADWERLWVDAAWCGGYIALFTGAMYVAFWRRDVVA